MTKSFYFDVTLKFGYTTDAKNKSEAIQILKASFEESYKIKVADNEIVQVIK